ncbi:MAG: site-specific integrase [Betaproteobacteria bacterium]|jgi:site-specific recombinase XerD|nr:site-specific integrase [Betaproteobacteria bacterium]
MPKTQPFESTFGSQLTVSYENIGCDLKHSELEMETDSILVSIAMLKEVILGKTYHAVAVHFGVTRTAVERRIKAFALTLSREVGIEGLNEDGVAFVQRLRACGTAITAALERYEPQTSQKKRAGRILTAEDIRLCMQRTRTRSPCPNRDVALLYALLVTGARPLEIARLEVHDYLNADGSVREESVIRAEVAINHKIRPLFFSSQNATASIDNYLTERVRHSFGTSNQAGYRGLDPQSPLFLRETGEPFDIVTHRDQGQMRFLCRGIHDTYRKIFRRTGLCGVSALTVRRTVATRLFERGAAEEQIGEVLGIADKKSVRELLPKLHQPLQSVVRELV